MMTVTDRKSLLAALVESGVFSVSEAGIPSVADKDSRSSVWIARDMMGRIGLGLPMPKLKGQAAGSIFENKVGDFISSVFPKLSAVRSGDFGIGRNIPVSEFDQYSHIADISRLSKTVGSPSDRREIKIAFGMDYVIKPDVVIYKNPIKRSSIGQGDIIVNAVDASRTPMFEENGARPTLHASVSCKLTLRSDRAQNARSEALNLIRSRKGKLPHIAMVTAEPTAGRISSLALGTGDIDCVYHVCLDELYYATQSYATQVGSAHKGASNNLDLLETLIEGRRLRDIADLPFDLAI